MNHVLILGGDGYLGWPTALRFSKLGYQVTVVDNYFRRSACTQSNSYLLYEVPTLVDRAKKWKELTGLEISVVIADLAVPQNMYSLFQGTANYSFGENYGIPNTVVHYAEQPSAPYSIQNFTNADFTLINNLRVTNNLIWAVKDCAKDAHIIKLGTMGEYGTPDIDIEEGWLEVEHKGRSDKFLFPRQASSLYHTTKIMDTDLLWFAVRTWGIKVTDLMQGPVYGIDTEETKLHPDLRTIFNYDEIFGTVLNRFITQAICKYPLTIYGKGGQTRGYLNINDTLQCLVAACKNPADPGELKIFNQIVETFSVMDLADWVQRVGNQRGHDVTLNSVENPRIEREEHYYNPVYQGLKDMGVDPTFLTEEILNGIFETVEKYSDSVVTETFFTGVTWK